MNLPIFESKGQDNGFFYYEFPLEGTFLLKVAGGTKKGSEHEIDDGINQDNYLACGPLLAVADGLGGLYRGDIASRIVLDCLAWYGQRNSATFPDNSRKTALIEYLLAQNIPAPHVFSIQKDLDTLTKGISKGWNIDAVCTSEFASAKTILKKLCSEPGKEMDSTIVTIEFRDGNIHWYHQGDSPLAYVQNSPLYSALAIPDHALGQLVWTVSSPKQTRETQSMPLNQGDSFILFSDALLLEGRAHQLLPQLPTIYKEAPVGFEVQYAAWKLIQEAWKGGDDTTIIVARVERN